MPVSNTVSTGPSDDNDGSAKFKNHEGRIRQQALKARVRWPGRSRLSLHTNCGFAVMHCPNLLQPTIAAAGIAAARKSCRSD